MGVQGLSASVVIDLQSQLTEGVAESFSHWKLAMTPHWMQEAKGRERIHASCVSGWGNIWRTAGTTVALASGKTAAV